MRPTDFVRRRRDAYSTFLRGFHGPGWKKILEREGINPKTLPLNCLDRVHDYCYRRGLRFSVDNVTLERTPRKYGRAIFALGSAPFFRGLRESRSVRSRLSRFQKAAHSMGKIANSLAKAGQLTGQGIPLVGEAPSGAGKMPDSEPENTDGTGGQSRPPVSLSAPRAILKTVRERYVVCKHCLSRLRKERILTPEKRAKIEKKRLAKLSAARLLLLEAHRRFQIAYARSLRDTRQRLENTLLRMPPDSWELC